MGQNDSKNDISIRLNRFIASSGYCSRRKADALIREGSVRVNGKTIVELGSKVYPFKDAVFVENKRIFPPKVSIYAALNKPTHTMSTLQDELNRPTVAQFCTGLPERVFPVGRLDWETEGLLIMTNDGDFAQKVAHPRSQVTKTYVAKVDGKPTAEDFARLKRGVSIIGGKAYALFVEKVKTKGSTQYDWIKIIIDEGRNQQVRHMFSRIGYDVKKLQRIAIGALQLGNLERGRYRLLDDEDIKRIFMKPKELRGDAKTTEKTASSTSAKKSGEEELKRPRPSKVRRFGTRKKRVGSRR